MNIIENVSTVKEALVCLDNQISIFEKLVKKNPSQKKHFNGYIKTAKNYKAQILRDKRLTPYIAKEVNQANDFVAMVKMVESYGGTMVLTDGCCFVA